jgi:hypothetical protein
MSPEKKPPENKPSQQHPPLPSAPAAEHVAGAQQLLQNLQARIGQHPELKEAITKLEMALSLLTVKTGGML